MKAINTYFLFKDIYEITGKYPTMGELVKILGAKRTTTIQRHFDTLEKQGYLVHIGFRKWELNKDKKQENSSIGDKLDKIISLLQLIYDHKKARL